MEKSLENSLDQLSGVAVRVSVGNGFPEDGKASLRLDFASGSWLRAEYWRVMKEGSRRLSSFDHGQKYGLPAPIDAVQELREIVGDRVLARAVVDKESGDLILYFDHDIKLQILNVTGYEIFEIRFADGTGEYSNYL